MLKWGRPSRAEKKTVAQARQLAGRKYDREGDERNWKTERTKKFEIFDVGS